MATELHFLPLSNGLMPFDDDSRIWLSGQKSGDPVKVKVSSMHNAAFFRKWWALVKCGFDWWQPNPDVLEIGGIKVEKNFDRFRKDIIIRTGRYSAFVNTKNEARVEADSISWAKMKPEEFEKLYNDTITVLLKIMPGHIKEEDLRNAEASILEFG